ncbi:hypothetical protein DFS33DRAFT_1268508, partial [Desarmillaria ectypa]
AYRLLQSYRPNSTYEHARFYTEKDRLYLKGMQITAGLTLGLIAWNSKGRPTAVKRYRDASDLAATHHPYEYEVHARESFERFVCADVKAARKNLALLFENDGELSLRGRLREKRLRYEVDGRITFERSVVVASDVCAACGKTDVKLQKCGHFKKVSCE